MPLRPSHPRHSVFSALALAAACLLPLAISSAHAQSPPGPNSTTATENGPILAAVQRYFQAADSGSSDAVRSVFWPSGRAEGVGGGQFHSWSAAEFATRNFRGQPTNTNRELTRTVEWLDVSGTGAVARVKSTLGANTYWDYFVLHKLGGEWKIGLKAFANPEKPS
jgi:hypothetical protein